MKQRFVLVADQPYYDPGDLLVPLTPVLDEPDFLHTGDHLGSCS